MEMREEEMKRGKGGGGRKKGGGTASLSAPFISFSAAMLRSDK